MGRFVRGDVVVLGFPFSDLSRTKRRPALVIADLSGDDIILCQITSQAKDDEYSVCLDARDFASGGLILDSQIRPNRLFTADTRIIHYRAGHLTQAKLDETVDRLVRIIRSR